MTSFWTGERIRLRAVEPEDAGALMRFAVEEERRGDLLLPPRSAESHRARAKELAAEKSEGDCFRLVIEALDTGEPVGTLGPHHANAREGWFEYGISLGADHRRKGYAREAVGMLLRYMFAERRFHRCGVRVLADNEASLAFHRGLGFVEEGRLREHVYVAGRHQDVVLFSLLAHEFGNQPPTGGH
ncbi:GNAT family N-acetyltransferase [uncultured Streptomyces sp.]|uniref:GNAT family N-acetyltransferase n=1 Tax=uncultured Streptomyces sp. TaxID=174707 RepID=UPI002621EAE1|nr:GNAT family protein [uncultured Streptomyces sp.]